MSRIAGPAGVTDAPRDPVPHRLRRPAVGQACGLIVAVAVGGGLRFWDLGASRLSYDESFTARAGRLPLGSIVGYLRVNDSHPPLDYFLRAPFARIAASDAVMRLPSAGFSLLALALFAWWMRDRGRIGLYATAIMALSAFQISHGREARMYAELEAIGVAVAMVVEAWLRQPSRRHAPLAGALTAVALLTHTSGLLLVVALFAVAGRRSDRGAWRWRAAIGLGFVTWGALWGRTFLVQARGHHSQWIPHSTPTRAVAVVGSLVTPVSAVALVVVAAIILGGLILRARDRVLAQTWMCCFAIPVVLAIGLGRFFPVLLDRTLTLFAWGAPVAIAWVLDAVTPRAVVASLATLATVVAIMVPVALGTAGSTSAPTPALNELAARARPGDIVAVEPASKEVELVWSLGVHSDHGPTRLVHTDVADSSALLLTAAPRTGRVWLLDFHGTRRGPAREPSCAPDWLRKNFRIECLELND